MAEIGKVKFRDTEAILGEDGIWSCQDANVAEILNAKFNPNEYAPVDNLYPFGYIPLFRAANFLKGEVETSIKLEPLPDGVLI